MEYILSLSLAKDECHRSAYGEEEPSFLQLGLGDETQVVLRRSHSAVRGLGLASSSSTLAPAAQSLQMMMQAWMGMQGQFPQQQSQNNINLEILRPKPKAIAYTAPPQAPVPSPAVPPPTVPPLALPPPPLPEKSAGVAEGQDTQKQEETELKAGVNIHQNITPEEQAKRMMDAFQHRSDVKTKPEEKGGDAGKPKRGRPKNNMKKPAATQKKPGGVVMKKEKAKAASGSKGKAARGSKGKAASGSKSKAASGPTTCKDREYYKKLPMEKRVALRPNGCGKCRYKPGCSPSCFS